MMTEQTAKIVEKLLDTGLPEEFAKEKQQLLSKLTQEPSEEAVKTLSIRKNINLKEAKERLEANYRKEVEEIEFKEIALRLSNAMKTLSPKMLGLEQRELGREEKVKEAVRKAELARAKVDGVVEECFKMIEDHKENGAKQIMLKAMEGFETVSLVSSIVKLEKEVEKLQQQVSEMKENTLKNKIKRFFGVK